MRDTYRKIVGKDIPRIMTATVKKCSDILDFDELPKGEDNYIEKYERYSRDVYKKEKDYVTCAAHLSIDKKKDKTIMVFISFSTIVNFNNYEPDISDSEVDKLVAKLKAEITKSGNLIANPVKKLLKDMEKEFSIKIKPKAASKKFTNPRVTDSHANYLTYVIEGTYSEGVNSSLKILN